MSDSLGTVLWSERHQHLVKSGKEGCHCASSMKELLSCCPLEVKKELHEYLGMFLVREKSTGIGYRDTKVELLAACSNVSTADLMKVLEHRASMMKDKLAQKVIRAVADDEEDESTDSESGVMTNLVWVDNERGDQVRLFSEGEMWNKIEELATFDQMEEIDLKVRGVDTLLTDIESDSSSDDETLGDRNMRIFIRWASDLLCSGSSNEYPLKLYSDALVLDRFFCHMNESCGSLTIRQYDDFKETIIPLYTKKAIEYALPSRLDVRRYTYEFTDNNVMTRVYEPE